LTIQGETCFWQLEIFCGKENVLLMVAKVPSWPTLNLPSFSWTANTNRHQPRPPKGRDEGWAPSIECSLGCAEPGPRKWGIPFLKQIGMGGQNWDQKKN